MGALSAAALSALIGIVPFAVGILSYRRRQLSLMEQEARLLDALPPGDSADHLRVVVAERVEDYCRHHRGEARKYTTEQSLLMVCGLGLAGLFGLQLAELLFSGPWVVLRPSMQAVSLVALLTSVLGVVVVAVRGLRNLVAATASAWRDRRINRTGELAQGPD